MRKGLWFWFTIVLVAAALVASTILLVDYVRPAPVFCDAEGACGMVKKTIFAYPFGIPTPVFGVSGLFAIGMLACLATPRARLFQMLLALGGALVAGGLLVVQALMGKLCPYCAVVDTAMILLAGLSIARFRGKWEPPTNKLHLAGAASGLVVAIGATLGIGLTKKAIPIDVPSVIADEMRETPRGKVTVVDFADFECPFCRMTHAALKPVVKEKKDKVRVVRKHVPLRMHPHAADAARAACCGEQMGKGEEMADALFVAPTQDLTPDGCARIAKDLGLDEQKFATCVKSPEIEARIKKDGDAFKASKGHGLPTIWVDGLKLEGAQDEKTLRAAVADAVERL